ncbi:hypothetical protein J437_LFUL000646 [Ladona fulva]|uniref:Thyrotropin-releasing hormone receptor n=1 Tax=Ladona fulva TaxID=123851 RepID=A0A8K0K4D1_LADFU|nr:hypothetical protein J437_LFUL000646 [Ladona fulva]
MVVKSERNRWVWGEPGCALFIFSQNLGINASSLSLVAFTVERYVGICHPMRAQAMCTVSRAKKITMCVWGFAALYSCPWLGLTETKPLKYRQVLEHFIYLKTLRKGK